MDPKDLYSKALTAASVAEANGYEGLSQAFRSLALGIYRETAKLRCLGVPKIVRHEARAPLTVKDRHVREFVSEAKNLTSD